MLRYFNRVHRESDFKIPSWFDGVFKENRLNCIVTKENEQMSHVKKIQEHIRGQIQKELNDRTDLDQIQLDLSGKDLLVRQSKTSSKTFCQYIREFLVSGSRRRSGKEGTGAKV